MSPLTAVLIGTSLLGCISGVVGSFAVLRRRALVGDLVAHAALPGICLAFLLMGQRNFAAMVAGALVTGVLGIGVITFVCRWTRTKEDAAIGIVLSTFFGAGVVLSSIIQRMPTAGGKAGLETYIYGQAAGMVAEDIWLIGGILIVSLVVIAAFYKEFKAFSFDPDFARVQGWPTLALDLLMMGTLALVTVVGLPAVGVVLMAAMLITPAAAARLWTNRLGTMLLLAAAIGAASAASGTWISAGGLGDVFPFDPLAFGTNKSNLPTGPLIVLCGTTIFIVSLLLAPERGLISRAVVKFRLVDRIAEENLLRRLYEVGEARAATASAQAAAVGPDELLAEGGGSRARLGWQLWRTGRRGLIAREGEGIRLTPEGILHAAALTRRHRLWELFLIEGANIAPDHVDRDADAVEHLLPPALIEELEAGLTTGAAGRGYVPASPHEVTMPPATREAAHG